MKSLNLLRYLLFYVLRSLSLLGPLFYALRWWNLLRHLLFYALRSLNLLRHLLFYALKARNLRAKVSRTPYPVHSRCCLPSKFPHSLRSNCQSAGTRSCIDKYCRLGNHCNHAPRSSCCGRSQRRLGGIPAGNHSNSSHAFCSLGYTGIHARSETLCYIHRCCNWKASTH